MKHTTKTNHHHPQPFPSSRATRAVGVAAVAAALLLGLLECRPSRATGAVG